MTPPIRPFDFFCRYKIVPMGWTCWLMVTQVGKDAEDAAFLVRKMFDGDAYEHFELQEIRAYPYGVGKQIGLYNVPPAPEVMSP